jgi:dephospho-CoA kinase
LIEAGLAGDVDRLWVISCSAEHQLQRLLLRSSVAPEQAQKWIAAQMPLEEKEKYADTVIRNDGTQEEFRAAVSQQWEGFLAEQG